ncbi:hypothetical protein [Chitinophaga filiformis]|uniref:Uncharacterized protein n=1 Tax=Chitinophaga filiformis TaxID=104663 RepID=A0ABY4HVI4_CHIFI|nr:hypothetical protein [Chitinophaga filiformis]UPK67410.1 hypothetical protein MYF79_20930 [Chitinophaga filiformis]
MNDLLRLVIEAYGGAGNWRKFEHVSARLKIGGVTWAMKQVPGIMDDINVITSTRRQYVSFYPFVQKDWHNSFEPDKVAIINDEGKVIDELLHPRATFEGYQTYTPWSKLQLTYFSGYAMWTYLNVPFCFLDPGYSFVELEPWEENNEVYRRLQVTFPENVATHNQVQTFYIDREGLIKRHDYNVEILSNAASVHYLSDYTEVQGVKFATKRQVYARLEDNTPKLPEPMFISIDISDIRLG